MPRMDGDLQPLISHLSATTGLEASRCQRVVDDVLAYFSEQPAEFVRRRHMELSRAGMKNDAIYERLAEELESRRFAAAPLSARQLRRLIYG